MKGGRSIYVGLFTVALLLFIASLTQSSGKPPSGAAPWAYRGGRKLMTEGHTASKHDQHDEKEEEKLVSHNTDHGKWAYATFMAIKEEQARDDPYMIATRALLYQLLHHPKTKTKRNIPLIVLTPPNVNKQKIEILIDEGARVIHVEPIKLVNDFVSHTGLKASFQFSKLRLWQLEEFDRVLFIDAATLITRCIDEIWDETFVGHDMRALGKIEALTLESDDRPPSRYFMAGFSDTGDSKHPFPPEERDKMMAGVYMLKPDDKVFRYYEKLVEKSKFSLDQLMGGLLNYAHRRDGPMPWKSFRPGTWAVNNPGPQDIDGKVAMLHTKFWDSGNRRWLDRRLTEMWWRIQGQCEGFWLRRGFGAPREPFG